MTIHNFQCFERITLVCYRNATPTAVRVNRNSVSLAFTRTLSLFFSRFRSNCNEILTVVVTRYWWCVQRQSRERGLHRDVYPYYTDVILLDRFLFDFDPNFQPNNEHFTRFLSVFSFIFLTTVDLQHCVYACVCVMYDIRIHGRIENAIPINWRVQLIRKTHFRFYAECMVFESMH